MEDLFVLSQRNGSTADNEKEKVVEKERIENGRLTNVNLKGNNLRLLTAHIGMLGDVETLDASENNMGPLLFSFFFCVFYYLLQKKRGERKSEAQKKKRKKRKGVAMEKS